MFKLNTIDSTEIEYLRTLPVRVGPGSLALMTDIGQSGAGGGDNYLSTSRFTSSECNLRIPIVRPNTHFQEKAFYYLRQIIAENAGYGKIRKWRIILNEHGASSLER